MAWPDVFPVFSEEQFDDYFAEATPEEVKLMEEWYGVEKILNRQLGATEIVSVSLFWKPVQSGGRDYPTPTREILRNAVALGYADRFDPWDHYVRPLLELGPQILAHHPNLTIRVHLAKDLEFLTADLTRAGHEICLMKSSSINHAPGSLWRFLPLGEEGKLITVTDVDRLHDLDHDLARTRMMAQTEVGAWRVPVPNDLTPELRVCYLPFIASQFGAKGGLLEVEDLLKAFTWNCLHEKINPAVHLPNCGPLPMRLHSWPDYGFDEFFLAVAAYPRLAQDGLMTFVPGNGSSQLLTLDIEYATWGNPASEVIYYPSGSCCGQEESSEPELPAMASDDQIKTCENPKAAFLVCSRQEMEHRSIWQEYLSEANGLARLYHPEVESGVEENENQLNGLALVRAQQSLLQKALISEEWTHFIFLPPEALPVRSFTQLHRTLRLDPRSRMRVRSWEEERKTNILKAQELENLGDIPKQLAHFHSPWVCLSREDARTLSSRDLTRNFQSCPNPDECYFATALAVLGTPPLQQVAKRSLTWSRPASGAAGPALIARVAESGAFFAIGLPGGGETTKHSLHQPA